jgi:hypothetical protein
VGFRQRWLQRNRIDGTWLRPNFGIMKHIEISDPQSLAPLLCTRCGGLMRLVGSEPHPVEDQANLLTYSCTACDELLVLPASEPGSER